jgi:glutamine synthetase
MGVLQRQAVGGLIEYLPEYLALLAPTINSYTRLVKGAWAPTASTWGVENRTSAVRVIGGSASSQRIECRVPGADANPYLVAAAVIAAALHGIEHDLDPGPPVKGNAYEVEAGLPPGRRFPGQLRAAALRLDGSAAARRMLGDAFVDHFVTSRIWECDERDRFVDGWQLDRYFEII